MNIEPLKAVTRNRWSFILGIWHHRETIISLCRLFDSLPSEEAALRAKAAEYQRAQELAQREAEVLRRELDTSRSDLRALHEKHADLIRRKEAPEERAARDALHLAKLDLLDSHKRLETERMAHAKSKRHVEAMWRFIATRHRLEIPATEGSIRKILQEAERR